MANGTGVGMGLGARTTSTSTGKKSTSRTGGTGKKSTGPVGGAGGRPGAGRPVSGVAAGGRPDLVRMGQLLSGGGTPGAGGMPGAGVPAGIPGMFRAGIPSGGMPVSVGGLPTTPGDSSQYDFGMQNMGDLATLDFGQKAKTPTSYITGRGGGSQIGSVSEQDVSDFFSNLTMSKLENLSSEEKTAFDERMIEATKRKESLKWPEGIDPELMEQRITAAESEKWPNSADFFKKLRSLQTEPTTLQNVGSMLKTGAKGVGGYLQNLGQHMGVYQKPFWPTDRDAPDRRTRGSIIRGEGTPVDWRKTSKFISKKRAENYAAGITVPPGKEYLAHYMRGNEGRTQGIPYGIKFANAPDLLVPPKPSMYEAPRKTSVLQPQTQPQQSRLTGYSSYGGGSYGGLSPEERQYLKNAPASFGKEPTLVAGNEKKETFNLLEMLMGLLGLGGGKSTGKSPQKNLNREPGPGEIDTRPAQLGVEPGIR